MYSIDFPHEYNNNSSVSPEALFSAPVVHCEDARARMTEHIHTEASNCDAIVLWLDCDREGQSTQTWGHTLVHVHFQAQRRDKSATISAAQLSSAPSVPQCDPICR